MCIAGPNAVFAVYSDDERPRETVGTRYDMEIGMPRFGLGVFPHGIISCCIYNFLMILCWYPTVGSNFNSIYFPLDKYEST